MPDAARYAREKSRKLALQNAELSQNAPRPPRQPRQSSTTSATPSHPHSLTAQRAMALVDKNSRTIVKLSQLLAVYNQSGASEVDRASGGVVAARIELYKQRITRRLGKLAKVSE